MKIVSKVVLLICLIFTSAYAAPRFDGAYRVGEPGSFEYDYYRFYADESLRILSGFSGGDEAALAALENNDGTSPMDWRYRWEKKKVRWHNRGGRMRASGGTELTRDGYLSNSVFLVDANGKVTERLSPQPVASKEQFQVLGADGKPTTTQFYDSVDARYGDDFLVVGSRGRQKLIAPETLVESAYYQRVKPLHENFAGFFDGTAWGVLNGRGKVVKKAQFQAIRPFRYGIVGTYQNGKWRLRNTAFKPITNKRFSDYQVAPGELIAVQEKSDGKWTLINRKAETVAPGIIDLQSISPFTKSQKPWDIVGDYVVLRSGNHSYVFNSNGKQLAKLDKEFRFITPLSASRYVVSFKDKPDAIIDANGKVIFQDDKTSLSVVNGLVYFQRSDAGGLLSGDGKELVSGLYKAGKPAGSQYVALERPVSRYSSETDIYELKAGKLIQKIGRNHSFNSSQNGFNIYEPGKGWGWMDYATGDDLVSPEYGLVTPTKFQTYLTSSANRKYPGMVLSSAGKVLWKSKKLNIEEQVSPALLVVRKGNKYGVYNYQTKKFVLKPAFKRIDTMNGVVVAQKR